MLRTGSCWPDDTFDEPDGECVPSGFKLCLGELVTCALLLGVSLVGARSTGARLTSGVDFSTFAFDVVGASEDDPPGGLPPALSLALLVGGTTGLFCATTSAIRLPGNSGVPCVVR